MTSDEGPRQRFGGAWTEEKLGILRQYLTAYTTALKSQPFELVYIDAFAGTGRREELRDSDGQLAFPELDDSDARDFFDGSARIALQCDPPFHRCVFIERDAKKCEQLEQVRREWASRTIEIRQGDANEELRALASCDWSRRRAADSFHRRGARAWTPSSVLATGGIGSIGRTRRHTSSPEMTACCGLRAASEWRSTTASA